MTLSDLGYREEYDSYRKELNLESFGIGRIISEHKERYMVKTTEKDYEAEIVGNLRFTAQARSDFPAVGDWVAISEYDDDKVLIHAIFPRKTIIERKAVGRFGDKQIIATNIDFALIVQSVDRDFNINRIERYLAICHNAGVSPIIILNKIDLITKSQLSSMMASIHERISSIPILAISNETMEGIDLVRSQLEKGRTYCLLGSSGVGKSTLLNHLMQRSQMKTGSISESTHKGRHVTSHRELVILENGSILIDNPGMREVGIGDAESGLEITFDEITKLSSKCKYKNCTHTSETGCAVLEALAREEIDQDLYNNYLKMRREEEYFESTALEKKKKDKALGKMIKDVKKIRKRNKY